MRLLMLYVTIVLFVVGLLVHNIENIADSSSDSYIRDRVVMLRGDVGGCSGIQVVAPSGRVFILSARHCKDISSTGAITATDEHGRQRIVNILEIDKDADLLILSPMSNKGIIVADKDSIHEHIHTLTHGNMNPTYRTDGELLEDRIVQVGLYPVFTMDDQARCEKDGNTVEADFFGAICVGKLTLRMSTAWVVPGSSGGAAVNEKGQLIGIVSVSGGFFSGLVRLEDIHRFLANR